MSMFDSYQNLNDDYVAKNIDCNMPEKREYYSDKLPQIEFNIKGEFVGYSWAYGDTLRIELPIDRTLLVEDNAIIFSIKNQIPNENTVGEYGQKLYNAIDKKLWECKSIGQTTYVWEELPFSIPKNGVKPVLFPFDYDLSNKQVSISIYNFRMEKIYNNTSPLQLLLVDNTTISSNDVILNMRMPYSLLSIYLDIDKELSSKLLKGQYTIDIVIFDDTTSYKNTSYSLIVK